MSDSRTDLKTRTEEDKIEFFFAMFVDMHGKPCAKLVPAQFYDSLMSDGVGFAGFAAGPMGQSPADPDMIAIPDPDSYTRVPWQPGLAVLQCDIHVEGEEWPYSPRVVLKRQLARLAERGMIFNCGVEIEYFLVRRTSEGRIEPADPLDTAAQPCYDANGLTRMYDHLTVVSTYLNQLGWGNYANDHEDANGQFEQNFAYAEALVTADRAVFFRYMVHTLAHQAGLAATFMPKPFAHLTGNGMHVHSSLWDAESGESLFLDAADARGLGLSTLAYQFIGGLLDHASALTAVTAPTVNSYKRIGVGPPASGATWAPAYATYGGNNRTQMLRVPAPGRVENRAVDGSANPYLAFTVMLAAGLDGIDRGLDPGEPNDDNLYDLPLEEVQARGIVVVPATLPQAVDELVQDDVLRDALGKVPGGDYVDYFAETKRAEFAEFHRIVSDWEVDRYLTLF
ncbi:MAG: type III glutamate--ammonia ligase [Dehalococcoidia bacterium]